PLLTGVALRPNQRRQPLSLRPDKPVGDGDLISRCPVRAVGTVLSVRTRRAVLPVCPRRPLRADQRRQPVRERALVSVQDRELVRRQAVSAVLPGRARITLVALR